MVARIGRGDDYILTNADAWRIRTLQESGELLEGAISSVLVSKSVQITQVQRLLGHENINTTM